MIPKIIHYTWFSGEHYPPKVQECIDSWAKYLPDYKLKLWDMDAVKDIDSIFLQEALSVRKWAFAADFVRQWAVYNEGGIYLDTDVMVYKSFDNFLHYRAFIGEEPYINYAFGRTFKTLTSQCFGAEKGHPFVKSCLDYYEGRHFITSKNENLPVQFRYDQTLAPLIQAEIARQYSFDWALSKSKTIQACDTGLTIFPSQYFDNNRWTKITPETVCTHLTLNSWRDSISDKQEKVSLKERIFFRFVLPYLRKFLWRLKYVVIRFD